MSLRRKSTVTNASHRVGWSWVFGIRISTQRGLAPTTTRKYCPSGWAKSRQIAVCPLAGRLKMLSNTYTLYYIVVSGSKGTEKTSFHRRKNCLAAEKNLSMSWDKLQTTLSFVKTTVSSVQTTVLFVETTVSFEEYVPTYGRICPDLRNFSSYQTTIFEETICEIERINLILQPKIWDINH